MSSAIANAEVINTGFMPEEQRGDVALCSVAAEDHHDLPEPFTLDVLHQGARTRRDTCHSSMSATSVSESVQSGEGRLSERRGAVSFSMASLGAKRMGRFTTYCISQKGHDLTMALCSVVVLILTIVGLTLLFSHVFGARVVDSETLNEFFLVLYGASIVAIWTLLLLASLGKLTKDRQYRDQSETNFLRGGLLCLGTGGIVYYAVAGASIALEPAFCMDRWDVINPIIAIAFTCSEMTLIMKYSRIRINKSLGITLTSQFLIVLVIATNLCVWIKTVIVESEHEISSSQDNDAHEMDHSDNKPTGNNTNDTRCDYAEALQHIIEPYTWPLLIEFCVVSSTCMIAILERCGRGLEVDLGEDYQSQEGPPPTITSYDIDGENSSFSIPTSIAFKRMNSHQRKIRYYNSQLGFLAGWAMVILALVLVIVYMYVIATDTGEQSIDMEVVIFGTNMAISGACLITVPITMVRMGGLVFRDEEIRKIKDAKNGGTNGGQAAKLSKKGSLQRVIDRQLLAATNLAQMAFHVMSMIAGVEMGAVIIFANSLVSVVMASVQTIFINWYATQKRSTTEEHLRTKPGRQGLELLRCGNLALWLINTFAVKHPYAKRVHNQVFGMVSWAVVSNICQPLLILYHFHSVCCLAEVISHSYTNEYIGVTRPLRLPRLMVTDDTGKQTEAMDTPANIYSDSVVDFETPEQVDMVDNGDLGCYL